VPEHEEDGLSAVADDGQIHAPRNRGAVALPLLVALYGLALLIYKPLSPFEWDEILFIQAMDRFDIATHSPHPPGYPVYVGLAKPLYWLTGNAQLALQLVSIIGAMAAVCLLWLLARHLGASRRAATGAAVLLAAMPGFIVNANVGMSDVLGTAGAVAGVWALVAAWDRPERLPLAAAVCAAALGVRPQSVGALLPVAAVVLVRAARARRWRSLLAAAASGVVASLVCWLPAVLLTGPARFMGALRGQYKWAVDVDGAGQFSRATLGALADHWLVAPFGSAALALAFLGLLVAGAIAHWRAGRRRLVAVCLAAGGGFLVFAVWTMNIGPSVRYALPAVPFLALLAGGIVGIRRSVPARLAAAVIGVWCLLATVAVAGPALDVRRRRPAPVSEAMEWIAASFKPELTTVVCSGDLRPHVMLGLATRGFKVVTANSGQTFFADLRPEGTVLLLTSNPVTGTEVLFAPHWDIPQLSRLTRQRYDRCVVARAPDAPSRPAEVDPLLAAVTAPALAAAERGTDLLVPAAAHAGGRLGSFWTTDLVICNTDPASALTVELSVVARPGASVGTAAATRQVPPGGNLALPDVLSDPLSCNGQAALQLRSKRPFAAFWRTFDRSRARSGPPPALMSAVTPAAAVDRGAFDLGPAWPASGAARCNLGFVNLGNRAAEVELRVVSGKDVTTRRARVPATSSVQIDNVLGSPASGPLRAEFRASTRLLAYAAVVEAATGRVAYILP
jgi:4-amino-4-deoxy-L-arabinose transferase-like glycosyltransferase